MFYGWRGVIAKDIVYSWRVTGGDYFRRRLLTGGEIVYWFTCRDHKLQVEIVSRSGGEVVYIRGLFTAGRRSRSDCTVTNV